MKKVFNIISIVAVLLTVVLVSMNFVANFSSGNKIYKDVYDFSNNTQMSVLINDINKAGTETKVVANSVLDTYQKEYLPTLTETIKKLNDYFSFLSIKLSQETTKSNQVNQISKELNSLKNEKNSLLLDLDDYLTKIKGNTQGRIETSVDYLIEKSVDFLYDYSQVAIKINNLVNYDKNTEVEQCLIDLHLQAISKLKDDYKDIYFAKNSISVVKSLNSKLSLSNNNFNLDEQGIYSPCAELFKDYIQQCDMDTFIESYLTYSILVINPDTEKDVNLLAYYYLDTLTEVL